LHNVDLRRASLDKANLQGANLDRADLRQALLNGADLRDTNLIAAVLIEAMLKGADLRGATCRSRGSRHAPGATNFWKADLSGANLKGSNATERQIEQARSLKGAIKPDGTRHK
jgi:uncharacterized protein YjbI with pentapeptide repeats